MFATSKATFQDTTRDAFKYCCTTDFLDTCLHYPTNNIFFPLFIAHPQRKCRKEQSEKQGVHLE